jgi:tRNA pseudouridine55 synthase
MASGVLPLVLGRATRLAQFLQACDKEYSATIRLGRDTDTYDAQGVTVHEGAVPEMSDRQVRSVLRKFIGTYHQIPPMFSAVRVGGERLYEAARRRESRRRPRRQVTISHLALTDRRFDQWDLQVRCSAGTYVRSLAYDVGQELGCGAHLARLRRTRSGSFTLEQSVSMERILADGPEKVVPLNRLLLGWPEVRLSPVEAAAVTNGRALPSEVASGRGNGREPCRLVYQGQLIAIARLKGDTIHPFLVFVTEMDEPGAV